MACVYINMQAWFTGLDWMVTLPGENKLVPCGEYRLGGFLICLEQNINKETKYGKQTKEYLE